MDLSSEILSNLTVYSKYAKFLSKKQRRETWKEICDRNKEMHIKKFPQLKDEINNVYNNFVIPKKVLPSMRSIQFAGRPIELNPARGFNCCYLPINHPKCFAETMFLLLGGTGVGYSVQKHHIEQLPEIRKPLKSKRYVVEDSIAGWADAIKVLMMSYMNNKKLPLFDFSDIREKGSPLVTTGGKAPGPEPLKACLFNLQKILDRKKDGEKLTSLEVHDMICFIADVVLSGGIRRAALICGFNLDDEDMLTCKFGNWWELNPQRARANNSAIILRHKFNKNDFKNVWEKIKNSGSGEPGIYLTNNIDMMSNPCCEIALKPFQMCNLTEINVSDISSQEELNERAKAAAFLGTLQASYTDFFYLRDIWKKTTEKEALIGVGMTGIASGEILKYNLTEASEIVLKTNEEVSKLIGINKAARTTCIKPSGTTSLVVGSSSGIHAWHSKYYIRNIRFGKNETIYKYFKENYPELVEDDFLKPSEMVVIGLPIKAPDNAILRSESAIDLLERVKKFSLEWVKPGHRKGDNTHNVSATISVDSNEWDEVGEWMWENKDVYNGLAILPKFDHTYKQAPFQECSEEEYLTKLDLIKQIDFSKIKEIEDSTTLAEEIACSSGICEI